MNTGTSVQVTAMAVAYRYIHEGFAIRGSHERGRRPYLDNAGRNAGRHDDLNDCNYDVEHDGTMIEIPGRDTNT